jgi:lantibiotic biosynthesis protein
MRSDAPAFLEVATRLGHQIADSAIWYDGRCNWLGALPSDEVRLTGRAELAAVGPDLYGGTSGVALFLAEAGAMLDDDRLRRTALGAVRLALDHADRVDRNARDGLYEGSIGIAYAAARVAALLGADDVHARARELLVLWRRNETPSRFFDLMGGCSGAVAGLVALNGLVAEPWLVDAAARLGDELIARADATTMGWSWGNPGQRSMHNLCGYAHGAAGVGHAFTELFALSGEARFREAAVHAFDYERSWLDARTGTWPDLRDVARRAGRDAPAPAAETWCNGAPGIALSRMRAAELLGSATLRHDADLALAACERYVAELLARAPDDFCLCHGASGAADVLLHGAAGPANLAAEVGLRGMELYARPGPVRFPCGVPLGDTPGLLLGFAGIGMFYLRLFDLGVQSPLLIHAPPVDTRVRRPLESDLPGRRRVP